MHGQLCLQGYEALLAKKLIQNYTDEKITGAIHDLRTLRISPSTPQSRIIVAIDYGTTFSAVAYYICDENELKGPNATELNSMNIVVIKDYPGNGTRDAHENEVPTISLYLNQGGTRYIWGNGVDLALRNPRCQIPVNTPKFELVKLLLSDDKRTKEHRARLKGKLERCGITDVKVIGDFLRELRNNAVNRIILNEGQAVFDRSVVTYVLSLPPEWSPPAIRTMLSAAKYADMPVPEIVAEQEAAALMVLSERARNKNEDIQVASFALK